MNKTDKSVTATKTVVKCGSPSLIICKIKLIKSKINKPAKILVTKNVVFFFLIKSSVVKSHKFFFAIVIYFGCDCL